MTLQLLHSEFTVLIYEEHFIFFFISADCKFLRRTVSLTYMGLSLITVDLSHLPVDLSHFAISKGMGQ